MADRAQEINKIISKNRKKKKNKGSKKKSGSTPESFLSKSNFPRESKYESASGEKTFQSDNYEDNKNVVENQLNGQDSFNFKNRTQRNTLHEQGKYNRQDPSNFGVNRFVSRNLHDEENIHERNHANTRKSHREDMVPQKDFANHDFHPFGIPEASLQSIQYLRIEVDRLTAENERLKDTLNNIQYSWSLHSNSDIDIIFKKRHVDEKFSYVLNDLVSKLLNGSISVEDLNKFCIDGKCEKEEKPSDLSDECLFAVDSSAEVHPSGNVSIPIYDASFHEILESPGDSKASPGTNESGSRFAKSCFNCGENHHMGDCPKRLDFRKIAIARKRAKSSFVPNVRYHVHGKNENDFKPGVISDELRDALGIGKNQIPPYVYLMRILDYPPGWLCEAAVESSGMVLYDSEGKAIKEDGDADGGADLPQMRVQYDPDKLIDYPGFNVPLPPDMIDESVELGLPPLQTHQLRCFVEQYMPKPNVQPSRKRKLALKSDRPFKQQRNEEDMEIENSDDENGDPGDFLGDFVPPLPESEPPPPPPPPPPGESNDTSQDLMLSKLLREFSDDNSASFADSSNDHFKHKSSSLDITSGTSSPSLAELEELKKKLVMELGISVDDNPSSEASQDAECNNASTNMNEAKEPEDFFILEDECIGSEEDSNGLSNISDSDSTHIKSSDGTECHKSLQRTTSQSKSVVLGTPSLSCHSPYVKLPDYDQFSKNVSSHIPFENLPNSIGTYQKLKGVLKTVKKKFNELMK